MVVECRSPGVFGDICHKFEGALTADGIETVERIVNGLQDASGHDMLSLRLAELLCTCFGENGKCGCASGCCLYSREFSWTLGYLSMKESSFLPSVGPGVSVFRST